MLQATLDRYMADEGVARYRNSIESAKERGEESSTRYGQRLIAYSLAPLSAAVKEWLESTGKKFAGHRGGAYTPLTQLTPDVAAFVALRAIVDCLGLQKGYTNAAVSVGSLIEDEVRFAWLCKHHPGLFKKLDRQLAHCMSYNHKRTVIVHAMNKVGLSEGRKAVEKITSDVFAPWTKAVKTQVGMLLIELTRKATGLVDVVVVTEGRKRQTILSPTAKTTEWIRSFNEYAEVLDPVWLPTVEAPTPWSGPYEGGYSSKTLPGLPLVKRTPRQYLMQDVAKANMPDVYAAINALQETPWKINRRVYGVLRHYWEAGLGAAGIPASEDAPLPTKPVDIETNVEARKEWSRRAAIVYKDNAALTSVRIQTRKLLNLAQKFANVERFFFPYQLDFRGRVYSVPTFLSPQGSDVSRGLLLFAEGVPMQDEQDAYWLGVYGANLFGKDKCPFEERIQWTKDNEANIRAVAKDPLGCQWWHEADSPWQFLAWCIEWDSWKTVGYGFKTHFPVCLDGTNNGLQLLSMLTRDEVAGAATNVLPNATPADIYADVAEGAKEIMAAEASPQLKPLADYWLAFGVNRKTTKRPVMVLPYGGTYHSCRDYVSDWYADALKARGEELPDRSVLYTRAHYLSKCVWQAVDGCVGRPREAMAWLQQCAAVFAELNMPIRWTAPSGFPVLQAYKDLREVRVVTSLGDSIKRVQLMEEHPTKLSKVRQKNGISPNFVHSCDAAALVTTIAKCQPYGIRHFCMIHDSYGTHAPKVHEMAACLRDAFVQLFSTDRLAALRIEFRQQLDAAGHTDAELPELPTYGSLDMAKLYESEFFFA